MEIGKIIKNNAKVYVILSVIILLGTIGVSYALVMGTFNNIGINTSTDEIKASITYDDSSSAKIESMGEMMPISDSEVNINTTDKRVIKTKFNVIGSASNPDKSIYDISLRDINIDCELRSKEVKWRLYKGEELISEGNLSPAFDTMNNNRLVLTNIQEDLTTNTDSYTFLLWISEACDGDINNCSEEQDQSKYLNKHLSGNIAIEVTTKSKKELTRLTGDENSCTYIEELIPLCNKLTYNGKEQELIKRNNNYILENNTGLDAREYKVIARLKEGYKWNTGETKERVLSCSIGKKDLSIKSLDQTIIYGDKISSNLENIEVSGLAEGDSIKEVNLSTSISGVGEGVIRVDSIVIVDSTGREVTDNYNIKINSEGRLTILGGDLTITIKDAKYTYDGKEKVHGEVTVTDKDNKEIKDLEIGYKYYEDNNCTKELNKMPVNAGNYYVKGLLEEQRGYQRTESNCANILIEKAESKIEVNTDKVELVHPEEKNISYKYTGDGEITCQSDSPSIATCEVNEKNKEIIVKSVSEGNTKIKLKINEGRNYKEYSTDIEVVVTYQKYTITLEENGATKSGTKTLYGKYLDGVYLDNTYQNKMTTNTNKITVPEKEGYTFNGYYSQNTGGVELINKDGYITNNFTNSLYKTNTTLYAKWTTNNYTITLKAGNGISTLTGSGWNGTGTNTLTKSVSYGTVIDLNSITPAFKDGYSGYKWVLSSGSGTLTGTNFTVGAGVATLTVNATTLAAPSPSITTTSVTKIYGASVTTLIATQSTKYDSGVTVKYNFGYSSTSTGTYIYGTLGTSTTYDVSATSHVGVRYYKVQAQASDGILTSALATWNGSMSVTINNAKLTFDANTGTLSGTSPLYTRTGSTGVYTGITNSTTGTIPIASKTGYTFNGWYDSATGGHKVLNANGSFTGSAVSGYSTADEKWAVVADKTLYAQYTVNSYKLTVNPNGGSFNGSTSSTTYTQDYGSITLLPKPTRTGYTFNGWTLTTGKGTVTKYGNGFHNDETFATSNNSIGVYNNSGNGLVKHTKIAKSDDSPVKNASYMIQITTNGEVTPGLGGFYQHSQSKANGVFYHVIVAKVPVGYTLSIESNPTGDGRVFTWLTSNAGTGKFETYIYKLNCGSTGTFDTFGFVALQGAAATVAKPVTWYVAYANVFDATNGTTNADTTQTYTFGDGDGTLTAQWTPNNYTITYNYQNNIVSEDASQYIFHGWSSTERYSAVPLYVYSNAGAWTGIWIPLLPHKKPNTNYIISYSSYRSVSIAGPLRVYPPTLDASSNVISWHHFYDIDTTNESSPLNTWTKHERTFNSGSYSTWPHLYIDFDNANQGPVLLKDIRIDEYSTETKTYGATYGTMPVPVRTGYTFLGWYTSPDGQGTKINESTPISIGNKTLYASWKKTQYKLTVNPSGGSFNGSTSSATYTQDYGNVMVLPKPTRAGYIFNGWTLSSGKGTVTKYGNGLYNDETFATSNNNMVIYNYNNSNGTVVHTKIATSADNPIKNSSYMMQITTKGEAGPGLGGFSQVAQSKANGVFYHVVVAKVPVGYTLNIANNAIGTGATYTWLTSNEGTGKFEAYVYKVICGSTGTFSTLGYLYIDGAVATAAKPVTWYVAYANMFDATNGTTNVDTTQTYTFGGGDGTLTANWTPQTYTITFDANGGSLGKVPSTMTKTYGVTLKLPTDIPTRANYTFLGWSTSSTATSATYAKGASYTSNAGTTLYAVWKLAGTSSSTFLSNLFSSGTKKTVTNHNIQYYYDTTHQLMNDRLGGTEALGGKGNIRYWGKNPNNYIYFNCSDYNNQSASTCEIWRIIGQFDGKLKIIKKDSIGNMIFGSDTTWHYWVNWNNVPSDLNTYLNGTYYNGLKNVATRGKIANITWNLSFSGDTLVSIFSDNYWKFENLNSSKTWPGNVALMYVSDYGYAADFQICNRDLSLYNNTACMDNDWLYLGSNEWLLDSPPNAHEGYIVDSNGLVYQTMAINSSFATRPTLFLNSTEMIKSGNTGSSTDPYQLTA